MSMKARAAMRNAGLFAAMMRENHDRKQGASSQKQGTRSLQNARYSRKFEVPRQAQSECDLSTIHSNYDDSDTESWFSESTGSSESSESSESTGSSGSSERPVSEHHGSERPVSEHHGSERLQLPCQGHKTKMVLAAADELINKLSGELQDRITELESAEAYAQKCHDEALRLKKSTMTMQEELKRVRAQGAASRIQAAQRRRAVSAAKERFEQEREKYNQARAEVSALRDYCKSLEEENSRLKEQINTLLAENNRLTEENMALKQEREECDALADRLSVTIQDVKAGKNFFVRTAKTSVTGNCQDYTFGVRVGNGDEPLE